MSIQTISAFSGLLPVVAGVLVFAYLGTSHSLRTLDKVAVKTLVAVILFKLIGTSLDLAMGFTPEHLLSLAGFFYEFIVLFEASCLVLIAAFFISNRLFTVVWKVVVPVFAVVWNFCQDFRHFDLNNGALVAFDLVTRVIVIFMLGKALFNLTKVKSLIERNVFLWIFFGSLLYAMTTFLILALQQSGFQANIWSLVNYANIATNLIMTSGFFILLKYRNAEIPDRSNWL